MEHNDIKTDDILSKIGSEVIITYKHIHGGTAKRQGILMVDKEWVFLYDKGKSGREFNCAFPLYPKKEYEKILSIDRI